MNGKRHGKNPKICLGRLLDHLRPFFYQLLSPGLPGGGCAGPDEILRHQRRLPGRLGVELFSCLWGDADSRGNFGRFLGGEKNGDPLRRPDSPGRCGLRIGALLWLGDGSQNPGRDRGLRFFCLCDEALRGLVHGKSLCADLRTFSGLRRPGLVCRDDPSGLPGAGPGLAGEFSGDRRGGSSADCLHLVVACGTTF